MKFGLDSKVAIVGGGSQGLGRACAMGLAREGANVAICSRNGEVLSREAVNLSQETGSEVIAIQGDLSKEEDIKNLITSTIDHFGRLDILVNNSGGPPPTTAETATEEQWEMAINMALLFFARMTREALPHLKQQGDGSILNILSSTVKQPLGNLVLSSATRMGVVGYAKNLADEVAKDGVLINNVLPGFIETDRMMEVVKSRATTLEITEKESLDSLTESIPMGRLGRPEDLANLVVFLASDAASYITGTSVPVDGGFIRSML